MNNPPVLDYQSVTIYRSYKGDIPLSYWYALSPNHQAERDGQDFDVRRLPAKYTSGLIIENNDPSIGGWASTLARLDAEQTAHLEALRRAIDDGFDFAAASQRKR
jgi:hypothetical protein